METRKVDLDIETAKAFYLRGGETKRLALSVYKEYELNDHIIKDLDFINYEKEINNYFEKGYVFYNVTANNGGYILHYYVIANNPSIYKKGSSIEVILSMYVGTYMYFIENTNYKKHNNYGITPMNYLFLYNKNKEINKQELLYDYEKIKLESFNEGLIKYGKYCKESLDRELDYIEKRKKEITDRNNKLSEQLKFIENLSVISDIGKQLNF